MFSDLEVKPISFYKPFKGNKTSNQDTQTEFEDIELCDEEVQVIERDDQGTQTNLKEMVMRENLNIDEKKLEIFLKNAYTLVNDALNSRVDENFEFIDEEENEEYISNLMMRLPCIENKSEKFTKISDMCWNSTGNILALTYYIDNHLGPCSHSGYINFLKFRNILESKTLKKKFQIETDSCIKSIDSHPKNPNLFVCSSYIGEIYIINLGDSENKENDYIQNISKIDSYFHKECVVAVKWIKIEENNYYIISLSEEGRLLLWNPDDKLNHPVVGFNLKFTIGKNTFPINPTIFADNPFESLNFVVGTLDGNIYKCAFNRPAEDNNDHLFQNSSSIVWRKAVKLLLSNMSDKEVLETKTYMEKFCKDKNIVDLNPDEFFKLKPDVKKIYKNALKSNYEKHISFVTGAHFNYFVKNLFLTCSFDGSIRIYHQNFYGSKYIISNNLNSSEYYTTAIWSPYKPGLIISGTSNGRVSFLKLSNKSMKTVHEIDRQVENSSISHPVNKIKWNNFYKNIIAVIYEDGIMDLYKLSDDLYESKYDEVEKLNKIIFNLLN